MLGVFGASQSFLVLTREQDEHYVALWYLSPSTAESSAWKKKIIDIPAEYYLRGFSIVISNGIQRLAKSCIGSVSVKTFAPLSSVESFTNEKYYSHSQLRGIGMYSRAAISSDGKKIFYVSSGTEGMIYDTKEKKIVYQTDHDMTHDEYTSRFLNERLLAFSSNGMTIIYDLLRPDGLERESITLNSESPLYIEDEKGVEYAVFVDNVNGGVAIVKLPRLTKDPLVSYLNVEYKHIPDTKDIQEISLYRIDETRWLLIGTTEEEVYSETEESEVTHSGSKQWVLTLGNDKLVVREKDSLPVEEALRREGGKYPFLYDTERTLALGTFWYQVPEVRKQVFEFLKITTPLAVDVLGIVAKFVI